VEAKPIDGTIIVNIGDALEFWTKGKMKSTVKIVAAEWN